MINKLNKIQLLGILLGVLLCLCNCEKQEELNEELPQLNTSSSHVRTKTKFISWEELKQINTDVVSKVEAFNALNFDGNNTKISTNDFSIETSTIQVIDQKDFITYTFFVRRNNPEKDILENFSYKAYTDGRGEQNLLKYHYTFNDEGNKKFNSNLEITSINEKGLSYRRSGGCSYEIVDLECTINTVCTGDGHPAGDDKCECDHRPSTCDPGGSMSCEFVYGWNCSNAGGGVSASSTDPPNDGEDTSVGTTGGGGGSSGNSPNDDSSTTTSVPMEDPMLPWEPVERCINGSVLGGGSSNTYIDPEIFKQVQLNFREWAQINNTLQNTSCSEEAQQEAIDAIWEIFDEEICPDFEFVTSPCLKSVYDQLGKASAFEKFLAPFAPTTSVANLRLSAVDVIPLDSTDPPGSITYGIQSVENLENFPEQKPIFRVTIAKEAHEGRPKILAASTIIHEVIHAEMRRILLIGLNTSFNNPTYDGIFDISMTELLNALNDYQKIQDFYTNWIYVVPLSDIPTDEHHEAMVAFYKQATITALKEFDDSYEDDDYEALFWFGGIYETKAWDNLPEDRREELRNRINDIFLYTGNEPFCD